MSGWIGSPDQRRANDAVSSVGPSETSGSGRMSGLRKYRPRRQPAAIMVTVHETISSDASALEFSGLSP